MTENQREIADDILRAELEDVNDDAEATFKASEIRHLLADLDKHKRGAKTLGEIIEKQCRMALDASGMHHVIDPETGDGDWGLVWEKLSEQGAELSTAQLELEKLKPRTITTAEELNALPVGSVVLDGDGDVSQKRGEIWVGYEMAPIGSSKLAKISAKPFTVLHVPDGV